MVIKSLIPCHSPYTSIKEDANQAFYDKGKPQRHSSAYQLAYDDIDFIMRHELRPM